MGIDIELSKMGEGMSGRDREGGSKVASDEGQTQCLPSRLFWEKSGHTFVTTSLYALCKSVV